ncbi:RNA-directed DNA polymerase, eukaryota [Tanacetum coccineum]
MRLSSFGRKRLCIKTKHVTSILETFKLIVKGRVYMVRAKELFTWNPTFLEYKEREYSSDVESAHYEGTVLGNSQLVLLCIWEASIVRRLYTTVGRWNGESIIMGDFNEVRSSEERRGSCFNPYSARYFDRFISNAGLVDVTLEGYAFTWAHPSASKMSKLDRFLVSDGIFSLFPSITENSHWLRPSPIGPSSNPASGSQPIGNGDESSFGSIVGSETFLVVRQFPRLFRIGPEQSKARWAVKLSAPIDISFRRNARGGIEEHLLADLTSLMDSVTLSNSGDRWVCDLVSDGNFRVKEIRNYIDDLFLPHQAAKD